jgi:GNAT superfamily N-acetyltransferase
MHIRPAHSGDEPRIAGLIQDLAVASGETSHVTETMVRRYLEFPGNVILLAEQPDGAVGLISYAVRPDLYHGADCCEIEELVVVESERNAGIGSALVTEVLKIAARLGCAEVSVSTLPDNTGAIRFYKSHGLVDEAVLLEIHL